MTNKVYRLVEIYGSVQGEGAQCGRPVVFARFSHCSHKCTWCDTKFDEENIIVERQELVDRIADIGIPSVVFTGGEPAMQLDASVVSDLQERGITCAIETNGYFDVSKLDLDWICVSPKNQMGGPIEASRWKQRQGNELKIVFPDALNLDLIFDLHSDLAFDHYYIQPCQEGSLWKLNIENAINFVKANPRWKISTQVHKFLGVR